MAYLYARGGNIGLRSFGAHEEGSGAVATVKGHRVTIAGGFTRSGKAPSRHLVRKLGGQVFVNTKGKKWRGHMTKVKSGVYIPSEMTSGSTLAAFERVAAAELPAEAAKALAALLPGK